METTESSVRPYSLSETTAPIVCQKVRPTFGLSLPSTYGWGGGGPKIHVSPTPQWGGELKKLDNQKVVAQLIRLKIA